MPMRRSLQEGLLMACSSPFDGETYCQMGLNELVGDDLLSRTLRNTPKNESEIRGVRNE